MQCTCLSQRVIQMDNCAHALAGEAFTWGYGSMPQIFPQPEHVPHGCLVRILKHVRHYLSLTG